MYLVNIVYFPPCHFYTYSLYKYIALHILRAYNVAICMYTHSLCPNLHIYIHLMIMQLCPMCDYCACICLCILYCKSDFIWSHFHCIVFLFSFVLICIVLMFLHFPISGGSNK